MPKPSRLHAQRTLPLEKVLIPKLIRIIKQFRAEVISDLQNDGYNYAKGNIQHAMPPESLATLIKAFYKRAGLLGAMTVYKEHARYIAEARQQARKSAGFGRNEQWIQAVIDYLNYHMLGFIQDITETMRADILNVLQHAVDGGWSIDQAVRKLRDEGLVQSRARVIARTEINRSVNVGHAVGAQSLPYEVDKKWSAASNHRTRHSHRQINNHTTGETDTFKVAIYKGDKPTGTFDNMLYPGDATASAGNTCNCRCRVIYIPKRDAAGRLVLRNPNQARIIPIREVPRYDPAQIAAILKSNTVIGVTD